MSRPSSVSVLEVGPNLAGVLSNEQRAEARRFRLPVAAADKGADAAGLLEQSGAFGAIVLDGMLIQALQISEDPTLTLIGPGSFVPPARPAPSMPVVGARLFVPVATRLVLLGERLLIAARRWPWIASSLHARMLEHSERLATQLAICQLPRVEDRLMALMWLLADSWGRVTPAGIRLRISLSHEVLGGLVGARRPTVTIALSKLAEQGSLIRHDDEWLINRVSGRAGERRAEGTAAAADGPIEFCLGGSRSGRPEPGRAASVHPAGRSGACGVRAGQTSQSRAIGGSTGPARTNPTPQSRPGTGLLMVRVSL
jgi:CRP/FNR family cyclic AMP-dependent transcriptional regulator